MTIQELAEELKTDVHVLAGFAPDMIAGKEPTEELTSEEAWIIRDAWDSWK